MSAFKNLATRRFGRLIVIAPIRQDIYKRWKWVCVCDCGAVVSVLSGQLQNGTKSCGCLLREAITRHGKSGTRVERIYNGMKQRCTNPKNTGFAGYGGRGIACKFTSFEEFYAEAGDWPGPGYSIDRYPNTNGHYEKGNIRWATKIEQGNNRRNNRLLTFNGQTHTIAEWTNQRGWRGTLIHDRLELGWSEERALTASVRPHRRPAH